MEARIRNRPPCRARIHAGRHELSQQVISPCFLDKKSMGACLVGSLTTYAFFAFSAWMYAEGSVMASVARKTS